MITRRNFCRLAAGAAALAAQPALASAGRPLNKRGCCLAAGEDSPWLERMRMLRPDWMYSWGYRRPEGFPDNAEFVPMLWGDAGPKRQKRRIDELKARAEAGEVKNLLGFNEPDGFEQANMTVERVVELWPDLMEVDVPLISPGCVHPDRVWMNEFMEQVEKRNLRVDAIAVHSYMGPSVEILVRQLESVARRFDRPLWITELAVGDWEAKSRSENRHSPERVSAFLRELLPALDALPFVHRYAWFSANHDSAPLGTSALFDVAGRLTPLGTLYSRHKAS
ncbi:MAG: glycosyl hydrolase [Planctomycetota bacterium]